MLVRRGDTGFDAHELLLNWMQRILDEALILADERGLHVNQNILTGETTDGMPISFFLTEIMQSVLILNIEYGTDRSFFRIQYDIKTGVVHDSSDWDYQEMVKRTGEIQFKYSERGDDPFCLKYDFIGLLRNLRRFTVSDNAELARLGR